MEAWTFDLNVPQPNPLPQNEEAEELMRKIEKEEEQMGYEDPDRKVYHLCIVNLVIGTLYCAKGATPHSR